MNKYVLIREGLVEASIVTHVPDECDIIVTDDGVKHQYADVDDIDLGGFPPSPGDYVVRFDRGKLELRSKGSFEAEYKLYVP